MRFRPILNSIRLYHETYDYVANMNGECQIENMRGTMRLLENALSKMPS